MATVYILRDKPGNALELTLVGKQLITGDGPEPHVERFPDEAAAREHVEMVIARRARAGYVVESRREESDDEAW